MSYRGGNYLDDSEFFFRLLLCLGSFAWLLLVAKGVPFGVAAYFTLVSLTVLWPPPGPNWQMKHGPMEKPLLHKVRGYVARLNSPELAPGPSWRAKPVRLAFWWGLGLSLWANTVFYVLPWAATGWLPPLWWLAPLGVPLLALGFSAFGAAGRSTQMGPPPPPTDLPVPSAFQVCMALGALFGLGIRLPLRLLRIAATGTRARAAAPEAEGESEEDLAFENAADELAVDGLVGDADTTALGEEADEALSEAASGKESWAAARALIVRAMEQARSLASLSGEGTLKPKVLFAAFLGGALSGQGLPDLRALAKAPAAGRFVKGAIMGALGVAAATFLAAFLGGAHPAHQILPLEIPLPFWAFALAACSTATIPGFALASRSWIKTFRTEWEEEQAVRSGWDARWMSLVRGATPPPIFHSEIANDDDERVHFNIARFQIPSGARIEDYRALRDRLATNLGTDAIAIVPQLIRDGADRIVPSPNFFAVRYTSDPLPENAHFLTSLAQNTLSFVIAAAFERVWTSLKIAAPGYWTMKVHSVPGAPDVLIETVWILPPAVQVGDIIRQRSHLSEKLGAHWLAIGTRSSVRVPGEQVVSILFGNRDPDHIELEPERRRRQIQESGASDRMALRKATKESEEVRNFIAALVWDQAFRSCGMTSPSTGDTPHLLAVEDLPNEVRSCRFEHTAGLSLREIAAGVQKLRVASGFGYIEARDGKDATSFQLLVAAKDPLDRDYRFEDYRERVLTRNPKGQPKARWAVGVAGDGDVVYDEFGNEEAHLLVAGATGKGKSSFTNSMILQLAYCNDPDDVEFWMVEPKNELQAFRGLPHVKRFVEDGDPSIYVQSDRLLAAAHAEMKRRYKTLTEHPQRPQNITQARTFGLHFPVLIVLLEEVSSYFGKPQGFLEEDKEAHKTLLYHADAIARLGRAAGVHLVMTTQYPKKENIPTTISNQARRLGLGVENTTASMLVIGSAGLEKIATPGRAMLRGAGQKGKVLTEVKGLFVPVELRNELVSEITALYGENTADQTEFLDAEVDGDFEIPALAAGADSAETPESGTPDAADRDIEPDEGAWPPLEDEDPLGSDLEPEDPETEDPEPDAVAVAPPGAPTDDWLPAGVWGADGAPSWTGERWADAALQRL